MQVISCIEILVVFNFDASQNAEKEFNSLGNWRLNCWAAELGMYYSNVYGKLSFAPLFILRCGRVV